MHLGRKSLLATALSLSVLLCGVSFAQEQAETEEQKRTQELLNQRAFSVDGVEYTNRDLNVAAVDFAEELAAIPAEERRQTLIDILIDMNILAKAAKERNLDEIDIYQKRLEQLQARTLRNAYVSEVVLKAIDEQDVQDRYVEELARFESEKLTRARHILLETKEEAETVIKDLEGGASFEQVAREKSTGPSAPNGGDLGFFRPGQMVASFETAANDLQAGEYSKTPVETQFGWHVIKVEERRDSEPPTFAQSAPQIRGLIINEIIEKTVGDLRAEAEIIVDPLPEPAQPATE